MRIRIGLGVGAALMIAAVLYFVFSATGLAVKGNETPAKKSARPGMALIPAGCFQMGNHFPKEEPLLQDSIPVHRVCLAKDFYMDVYEVTNGRFKACVEAGKCKAPFDKSATRRKGYYSLPEYSAYPMINVSWFEATAFCAFEGKRLPTEAEWEYAARGGLPGKRYPWGDEISCADANWGREDLNGPCWTYAEGVYDTLPVGSYKPNRYGLYDMFGNVWEWVNDWYDRKYYAVSPTDNPPGAEQGKYKIHRGGAWISPGDDPGMPTVSWRSYNPAKSTINAVGFRCVAD